MAGALTPACIERKKMTNIHTLTLPKPPSQTPRPPRPVPAASAQAQAILALFR